MKVFDDMGAVGHLTMSFTNEGKRETGLDFVIFDDEKRVTEYNVRYHF